MIFPFRSHTAFKVAASEHLEPLELFGTAVKILTFEFV
jgi:hypothetical protein